MRIRRSSWDSMPEPPQGISFPCQSYPVVWVFTEHLSLLTPLVAQGLQRAWSWFHRVQVLVELMVTSVEPP